MTTAQNLIRTAESQARAALSEIDTAFAEAMPPRPAPGTTAGQLLVQLAERRNFRADPSEITAALRKQLARSLRRARQSIRQAQETAAWLEDAAGHVEKGEALPPCPAPVPDHIRHAVQATRHYVKAGITAPGEIAPRLRDAARKAEQQAQEAAQRFGRFVSAGQVATSKGAAKLFAAHGEADLAEFHRTRAERATAVHRRKWGTSQ